MRLWGIDAPEYHQTCLKNTMPLPCGKYARQRLDNLIKDAPLQCDYVDRGSYKRIIARCYVQREDGGL